MSTSATKEFQFLRDVLSAVNSHCRRRHAVYYSSLQIDGKMLTNALSILQAKGAAIGDVYIATEYAHHDRRIPIPVCKLSRFCCSALISAQQPVCDPVKFGSKKS